MARRRAHRARRRVVVGPHGLVDWVLTGVVILACLVGAAAASFLVFLFLP